MDVSFLNDIDSSVILLAGGGVIALGILAFVVTQIRFALGCLGTFFMLLLLAGYAGMMLLGLYLAGVVFLPEVETTFDTLAVLGGLLVVIVVLGVFYFLRFWPLNVLRWGVVLLSTVALAVHGVRLLMEDERIPVTTIQLLLFGGVVVLLLLALVFRRRIARMLRRLQARPTAPSTGYPAMVKVAQTAARVAPHGDVIRMLQRETKFYVVGRTRDGQWARVRSKREVWVLVADLIVKGDIKRLPEG